MRTFEGIDYEHLTNLLQEARKKLPPSGLRDRIDSATVDPELSCPTCTHYWWNHNADGPCAVRETFDDACRCSGGTSRRFSWARDWARRLIDYRAPLLPILTAALAFLAGSWLK